MQKHCNCNKAECTVLRKAGSLNKSARAVHARYHCYSHLSGCHELSPVAFPHCRTAQVSHQRHAGQEVLHTQIQSLQRVIAVLCYCIRLRLTLSACNMHTCVARSNV